MGEETTKQELLIKEVRDLTFILIENNKILRKTVVRILKEAGATKIIDVGSGKEGMVALKSNRDIGIIICSDHLADADSRKFLQSVGQDKKFEATTQVLISANNDKTSMQKAIASGVDGYVVKPFPFPELKNHIEAAVTMRKKRLALKDLRVKLEVPVQLKLGNDQFQGMCVELGRTDCQIVVENDLGMGSRLQIRFQGMKSGTSSWYEPILGSIASASRAPEGGRLLKINFAGKPAKSHGVLQLISQHA